MTTVNRLEKRAAHKSRSESIITDSSSRLQEVITQVIEEVSQNEVLVDRMSEKSAEGILKAEIERIMGIKNYTVPGYSRGELLKHIHDYMFKYAMIQKYLDDPDCNNVMINRYDIVWIQVKNKRKRVDLDFGSEENLMTFVRSIQASLGGKLDQNNAIARFVDHTNKLRIDVIVEPISLQGPIVMIRKHKEDNYTMSDLVALGMLSGAEADYLIRAANSEKSIVWCGSGGSGKTTLMRANLEAVDETYRIFTMEEREELFLKHPGVISLKVRRNAGVRYGVDYLADQGLLMSIDIYVYGEIRNQEALALFDGSMSGNQTFTTTHASSPLNAMKKLTINMKRSGTDIPYSVLEDMLFESIDIIVMMKDFKVAEIVEVKNRELVALRLQESYEIEEETA
ncbi:MAG: CpaF family protein [Clostridia bacterium]|nr:CpaF family protein [Clostridia bacterium]